ncbi:multiubiquitin domain-containing protein [Paeniroseomonas aquatica]|uniref:Multiubiquitin domain-containing protein n=1 Tax=Paeniroseomonas aquatica TaxID=373043 RepID=A0ABT8A1X3_9PROT|nr:multiubiquitin domain-containing protein [Paeniroseomonas aquatica]MDN3563722.1 multiubiquitin domain-containing protein [Paeniroseomonas aquatica]
MTNVTEAAVERGKARHQIEVADGTLTYRTVAIDDLTPTGAQVAAAAGFRPKQNVVVLQVLPSGELEDVRPGETIDLRHASGRFVIVESDRDYFLMLDGQRYPWPCRIITGAVLRKLGGVPEDHAIYEEKANEPDSLVNSIDLVDLDGRGVESFVSRKPVWTLNIQGVEINSATPTILVSDALTRAGFDATQSWHIFLRVKGQAKREVQITDHIDLRTPGIEKIRLTPKEVNNGEALPAPRRDFALLDADDDYLDRLGLRWETVEDAGRRWLLIRRYPVPAGYTAERTTLALEIPPTYPGAQIDMFYTDPPLALASGRAIECTHIAATIGGVPFNGWSRHRGLGSPWNPAADNVSTHLALVESALAKEVGE